ncbi:MAG: dolichol-phosphate mannosyltransferase [Silanimonas sp.]|nr:MAG: dolichol-phosphate mannosyltransferase [Silanimonas sp.]
MLPALSVVVPAFNEAGNVGRLVDEIAAVLRGRLPFEMVFVDDASKDGTLAELREAQRRHPELRVLSHQQQGGQSLALRTGVKAARAPWVATLDGDGQNDPADIPKLLAERERAAADVKCLAGWRTTRRDDAGKRISSKIANAVRSRLLGDATPDTGCGLKLFEREAFLELPWFDHMHRYIPALMQRAGWKTVSVPVNHRPRGAGASKYTNLGRLLVAFADLRGVAWLIRRNRRSPVVEYPRED